MVIEVTYDFTILVAPLLYEQCSYNLPRMLKSPQPDQVKVTRKALGFTQKESADMVHCSLRAWQLWEAGDRNMPAGIWELFVIKTGLHPLYSKQI